jgi:hypothetical protein
MLRTLVSVSSHSRRTNGMGYISDHVSKIRAILRRIEHFIELLVRFRAWSEMLKGVYS